MESEEEGRQNSKTVESDEATGPFFLGNLDDVEFCVYYFFDSMIGI